GRLETSGTPVPVLADVGGNPVDGAGQFALSLNGSLAYLHGKAAASSSYPIGWMDSAGRTTPLLTRPAAYGAPRLSPDGPRHAARVDRAGRQGSGRVGLRLGA